MWNLGASVPRRRQSAYLIQVNGVESAWLASVSRASSVARWPATRLLNDDTAFASHIWRSSGDRCAIVREVETDDARRLEGLIQARLEAGRSQSQAVNELVEQGISKRSVIKALRSVTGDHETVWTYILQYSRSERGDTCDFHRSGHDDATSSLCLAPAVARLSGSVLPQPRWYPENLPHPSTMFIGACGEHVEDLSSVAARHNGDIDYLTTEG